MKDAIEDSERKEEGRGYSKGSTSPKTRSDYLESPNLRKKEILNISGGGGGSASLRGQKETKLFFTPGGAPTESRGTSHEGRNKIGNASPLKVKDSGGKRLTER